MDSLINSMHETESTLIRDLLPICAHLGRNEANEDTIAQAFWTFFPQRSPTRSWQKLEFFAFAKYLEFFAKFLEFFQEFLEFFRNV